MSALMFVSLLLAPVAPAETPRAFVTRLYASYANRNFSPLAHPDRVFTPPLAAAIAEDARLSRGEVGFVDGDPICQCQDSGGLKATIAELQQPNAAAAEAKVLLHFGRTETGNVRLKLAKTATGWRVSDIVAADEPSFLRDLQASNNRQRHHK